MKQLTTAQQIYMQLGVDISVLTQRRQRNFTTTKKGSGRIHKQYHKKG